jgi:hypothetical protein
MKKQMLFMTGLMLSGGFVGAGISYSDAETAVYTCSTTAKIWRGEGLSDLVVGNAPQTAIDAAKALALSRAHTNSGAPAQGVTWAEQYQSVTPDNQSFGLGINSNNMHRKYKCTSTGTITFSPAKVKTSTVSAVNAKSLAHSDADSAAH